MILFHYYIVTVASSLFFKLLQFSIFSYLYRVIIRYIYVLPVNVRARMRGIRNLQRQKWPLLERQSPNRAYS